jgi:hypothetical protein
MTPKEKAIELKHKMYAKILDYNLDYTDSNNIEELNIFDDKAKQCALIAVDEILKEYAHAENHIEDIMGKISIYIKYWQEVKQEIEAL